MQPRIRPPMVQLSAETPRLVRVKLAKALGGINKQMVLDRIWAASQADPRAQWHNDRLYVFYPLAKAMEESNISRSEVYRVRDKLLEMGILISERLSKGRDGEWWFAIDTVELQRRCPGQKIAQPLRPPPSLRTAGSPSQPGTETVPDWDTSGSLSVPTWDGNASQVGTRLIRNRGPILEGPSDRSIEGTGVGVAVEELGDGDDVRAAIEGLRAIGVDDADRVVARETAARVLIALENTRRLADAGLRIESPKNYVFGCLRDPRLAPLTDEQIAKRVSHQRGKTPRSAEREDELIARFEAAGRSIV